MSMLDLQETIDNLAFEVAEMKKRQSNFLRPVKVKSFDPATNKAVVEIADKVESHEIPVYTHAGAGRHWSPLKAGQQVTLMSPDGDINNAFVVPGGYHDGVEKPSKRDDEDAIVHGDEAAVFIRKKGSKGMVRMHVDELKHLIVYEHTTKKAWRFKPEVFEETGKEPF